MAISCSAGDTGANWAGGTIFNGSSSQNSYGFYIGVREVYVSDSANNYSNIDVQIGIKNNGKRFATGGWCFKYSIDGTAVCDYQTGVTIATNGVGFYDDCRPITLDGSNNRGMYINGIPHNDDGNRTIHIKVEMYNSNYGSYSPGYCVAEGDFALTSIPRKSSPSASNVNIESGVRLYTNRASSSLTHTMTVTFGNFSRTWTGVGDYVDWNTAENASSLYAQIPASTSGLASLSCTTYSGSTNIGTNSTTFYLSTVESLNRPSVSVTAIDTNKTLDTGNTIRSITGDSTNKTLIKYISNVQVSLSASARNSAYITSTRASSGNGSYVNGTGNMTVTFNNVDTASFAGYAVDSRGYPNSANANSLTLLDYTPLSINPVNLYRQNQTSNSLYVRVTGNYFKGSFNNTANVLTLSYKYKESGTSWTGQETWTTLTPTISQSSNTYSFDDLLGNNFDYTKTYDFVFKVEDLILIRSQELSSLPGVPIAGLFEDFIEAFGEVLVYKN